MLSIQTSATKVKPARSHSSALGTTVVAVYSIRTLPPCILYKNNNNYYL